MRLLEQIAKEAWHRKINALLALLAIVTAVALPVAFTTAGRASMNETRRVMRDMGYNLRIIPLDTTMETFWRDGYSSNTMPEEAVRRFARRGDLSYNHLLALLQRRVEWQGQPVLLTGLAGELSPAGKKKGAMIFSIERGTLYVGHEPGARLGLAAGDEVELLDRSFRVAQVLAEEGTEDDARVWTHLDDAQELLALEDRINEIKALECGCDDPRVDTLALLREELEKIVPEGKVLRMRDIADSRLRQRRMAKDYYALLVPIVLVACALWIAFLAVLNVRERREEIGILRALGHGSGRIAGLFLGKALVLGLLGAGLGFALGSWLALAFGPGIFEITGARMRTDMSLLLPALAGAPLFAAVCSLLPTALAVTQDPAATLKGPE